MFRGQEVEAWEQDSDISQSSDDEPSFSQQSNSKGHISRPNNTSSHNNHNHNNRIHNILDDLNNNNNNNNNNINSNNFNASYRYEMENDPNANEMGTYTVDEAITHLGFNTFQYALMLVASLVWISAATGLMLTNAMLLFIEDIWDLTDLQETCLASVPFVGEMFGAYLISTLSDRYGRKKSTLISVLLSSFFLTLSALATNFSMLVLCRMAVGFAVGGSLTALSLFTEFIPKDRRGELTFIEVSFWSIGAVYAVGLGWFCYGVGISWRWYMVMTSIPSWLALIPTILCPESPRFLLNNGEFDKLERLLEQISYWNGISLNEGNLRGKTLEYNEHNLTLPSERGQLKQLFYKKYRLTSFLVFTLCFVGVAAYFGVALFQTTYFESFDSTTNALFWETLVCTSGEIPGIFICVLIFDKIGRIPILGMCCFLSTLCFGGLIFSDVEVGLALIFIARMCVCAGYNVLFVYILEYYPTAIRATALGFAITEARTAGILASYISEATNDTFAASVYCICCLIGTICCFFLPTETLNKDLSDEIEFEESHMIDYGFGNEYDYKTHEYLAQKIFDDQTTKNKIKHKKLQFDQSESERESERKIYGSDGYDDIELQEENNNNNNNISDFEDAQIQDQIDGLYLPENDPLVA